MINKYKKRCSISLLLERCKSKLQWGVTSHWSEWASSKNLCCCLVSRLCLMLMQHMDRRASWATVHGISLARIMEWITITLLQVSFPTQGSNPYLLKVCFAGRSFTVEPPDRKEKREPSYIVGGNANWYSL